MKQDNKGKDKYKYLKIVLLRNIVIKTGFHLKAKILLGLQVTKNFKLLVNNHYN